MIHAPPNTMPCIREIWAFVSVDAEGNEGVCAAMIGGAWMPLIAADAARLAQLRPIAARLATAGNMRIRLVRFTSRVEEDRLDG